MKIFVTNLDDQGDRKKHMVQQMKKLGLNFEFIPCIDGRSWTADEVSPLVSPEFFRMYKKYQWLSNGAIAVSLTHLQNIYQKMIDEDIDYALVLEDDILLNPDIKNLLPKIEKQLKEEPINDILLLCKQLNQELTLSKKKSISLDDKYATYILDPDNLKHISSGAAYIINKQLAQKFIEDQQPLNAVMDWWESHIENKTVKQLRVVYPFLVTTGEFSSTLGYIDDKSFKGNLKKMANFFLGENIISFFRKRRSNKSVKITN
ncbi:glycosyltransferase involved in LPS biosynthesis [Saprospira grandis DSM 2844]|uniref:Glycosyltransferase involved in LPS biosynthesis n=1 Tax=Saprospira grandis DSM 2844 TaxID=694433 RepID=J0PB95_9BACT|nr:glycosyltransferase family 25 protein [Saprospira grandis]EJF54922.1 glycosyltransferase involved in LPS biosynthesis [Saprospira grandis DSM 2844]